MSQADDDQEAKSLPDWGKMAFQQYPSKPWSVILPGASADAIELVRQLVVYESGDRMEAKTASCTVSSDLSLLTL
jgi:hypothetical protein